MNTEWSLKAAAAALRQAAEQRDFEAVELRAREYADLARASMAHLPLAEAEARAHEAGLLMDSVRRDLCVARARLAKQKARLNGSAGYIATSSDVHTWTVRG
jgi:hypothetical protein